MQTQLAPSIRDTPDGQEALSILSACVHCGFCTATCPTFQLLGNELDGPRGRIDLMKAMLEGNPVTRTTQLHLDRCLTCRSCESTCPSGVRYGQLADIGRVHLEQRNLRPWPQRVFRSLLVAFLQTPALFYPAAHLAQTLYAPWRKAESRNRPARGAVRQAASSERSHSRQVLLLEGCVQPALLPSVNAATAQVLAALGVTALTAPAAGCCGALRLHLGKRAGALHEMRANIDAWWPYVERGVEAILMTASGCGATVKDYAHQLRHDPQYRDKALRVATLTKDLSEWLAPHADQLRRLRAVAAESTVAEQSAVAFQSPCSLQHGQQIRGPVEELLRAVGHEVRAPADAHLCCGSAGTYSILQPELANELRARKLKALEATGAPVIASANVGCICHLQLAADRPIVHWIELVASRIATQSASAA